MDTIILLFGIVLIIVGLIGIILPVLPGVSLVWCGLIVCAFSDNFTNVGFIPCFVITLLAVVSIVADVLGTKYGTDKVGASRWATIGAIVGSVIGLFFGPWGLLIGPFVGGAAGELLKGSNHKQAIKAGLGAWLGILITSAMKYVVAFTMIAVYIVSYFV